MVRVLVILFVLSILLLSAGVVEKDFSFTEPDITIQDGFDKSKRIN